MTLIIIGLFLFSILCYCVGYIVGGIKRVNNGDDIVSSSIHERLKHLFFYDDVRYMKGKTPSHSLVVKWLINKYRLHVFVRWYVCKKKWYYVVDDLRAERPSESMSISPTEYTYYEQAMEAGLNKALRKIEEGRKHE